MTDVLWQRRILEHRNANPPIRLRIETGRAEAGQFASQQVDRPHVRGKKIVTIEGIENPDGKLHKVQQAMIDELAPQCGFCTPGQVMTAVAFLAKNPKPSVDQTRVAMSGNLCRCGAYDHYLKAVMRAAREA